MHALTCAVYTLSDSHVRQVSLFAFHLHIMMHHHMLIPEAGAG